MGMNRKLKKAKAKIEKEKAERLKYLEEIEKFHVTEFDKHYSAKYSNISKEKEFNYSPAPEEIPQEISFRVKDIWSRIINKSGGAFYDLPNFCVEEDFKWLNNMIEEDFNSIMYDFEEEMYNNSKIEEYLAKEKYVILQEIHYKKDYIIENATENIYTYITTEERPVFKNIDGLKRLEDNFLEKGVVSSKEELYSLKSYKLALEYIQGLNK